MKTINSKCVVIFGGAGYIGSYFSEYLIKSSLAEKIYLADISLKKESIWPEAVKRAFRNDRVMYLNIDVRNEINHIELPKECDLVCNFAAVHREPGHLIEEYFETNILGAENVCEWADRIGCNRIIFTSSIAPYGVSEEEKTETALPVPTTAYGNSKLVAEKIHMCWQTHAPKDRYLSIVRPGVIFGPGEDGNVPRMIKAIRKRYFMFAGNKNTVKAGGYIKELCRAMDWVIRRQETNGEKVVVYNFSLPNCPSFEEYVIAISKQLKIRAFTPSVPFSALLSVAWLIGSIADILKIKHPFDLVRVRKLNRSNRIKPAYLIDSGYEFQYDLDEALSDWMQQTPADWGIKS